ncbi:MAG: outer membrane lipoprotein-sorting protein, partial [Gammaproteobacteria bacterium]
RFDDGLTSTLIRIEDSLQHAGVAVLIETHASGDPGIYVYSPELRRERRITTGALAGSMLGTDFSYEDFAHLQHPAAGAHIERLADADIAGHPAYVFVSLPADKSSEYSRIVTYLDRQLCLPVKAQFYARNGTLHKEVVMVRTAVRRVNEQWVPLQTVMLDHRRDSRSVLVVSDVDINPELPDWLFSPVDLRRQH